MTDHAPFSIAGIGAIVVDHQATVAQIPKHDTKAEILKARYQVGGPVPTALCLLKRFGAQVLFQGQWGMDPFGEMIERDLDQEKLPFIAPPITADARSGFAHVWLEKETGSRTIAAYRGSHTVQVEDLDLKKLSEYDALHLDGWSTPAAIEAAKYMQEHQKKVSIDLGSPKPNLPELLSHVNIVNCPSNLMARLFKNDDILQGAKRLLDYGPSEVIVTNGSEGAWHVTTTDHLHMPAFPVHSVDTNGAGDTFCGAVLYGSMTGWDPETTLRFSSAAAALKCRRLGNRAALPHLENVRTFLEENGF